MKIYFVTFKFFHHGKHSGYDKLIDYFPDSTIISGQKYELFLEWLNKQNRFVRKIGHKLFGGKRHWIEYIVLFKTKNSPDTIVHFLYLENQYKNFGSFKGNRKVVATFHQPPKFYDSLKPKHKKNYHKIDKAIVLSRNLIPTIENLVGKGKVQFIPHGVDTIFFKPMNVKKEYKILTVGNWLRDFELLSKIVKYANKSVPNLKFEIISLSNNKFYFKNLKNVLFRSGISESQLLNLYNSSKLLLLPLKECTANNALLEAMACGLPTIVTEVGGIKDYTTNEFIVYLNKNNNIKETVYQIINLLQSDEYLSKLSKTAIKYSKKFAWQTITKNLYNEYLSLVVNDGKKF
jgi:glycosyltransferase involved in cell wall biosynthesis